MNRILKFPLFHPLVFCLYPILSLAVVNLRYVPIADTLRSMAAALILGLCVFALMYVLARKVEKAALLTSVLLLAFFSYGHLYDAIKQVFVTGILVRHRYLLPIYILLTLSCLILIWKEKPARYGLTVYANVFAFLLLVISIYGFVPNLPQLFNTHPQPHTAAVPLPSTAAGSNGTIGAQKYPDIYYIILDSYGREDILKKLYGYDNSSFINELKKRGFYVAAQSRPNYPETAYSLGSSLNMNYVDALVSTSLYPGTSTHAQMGALILSSRVRKTLAGLGYKYVAIDNNAGSTAFDADVVFTPEKATLQSGFAVNPFEGMLINSTILRAWSDLQQEHGKPSFLDQFAYRSAYDRHRDYILFDLDAIKRVPELPGSYFVLDHIILPHPPFVLGPNGEYLYPNGPFTLATELPDLSFDQYKKLYSGQVEYANARILNDLDTIFKNSSTPPIIIIQGDHGPGLYFTYQALASTGLQERFHILNAYYFPNGDYSHL
jgi:hypothetical protein